MRKQLCAGLALLCAGCASEGESSSATAPACQVEQRAITLPSALSETSGVAASRRAQGTFWTHNDSGGEPVVYAIDADGQLLGDVRVVGADNRDWEDIAVGPCDAGSCLYIADTGDNDGKRRDVDLYRIPEPQPGSGGSPRAERFPARYPEGAPDSEAMFVLPSGEVYLVTKGRRGPVELYRYPLPLRAGVTARLERVAALNSARPDELLQVTGADASPNGEWVAVRAYRSLMLYRTRALVAGNTEPALVFDLTAVGEAQGEAVALADDGTVTLTSEGGSRRAPGTMARLRCDLPG